eukprot:4629507-Alexandrium_andersonii.AAC.1
MSATLWLSPPSQVAQTGSSGPACLGAHRCLVYCRVPPFCAPQASFCSWPTLSDTAGVAALAG